MNNPSSAPIGIFDSGVGGLTVAAALRRRVPQEKLIYLADAARLPYGTKSPGTVTRYALQAAHYLQSQGVKLLVIACNTASAHGVAAVRKAVKPLPVLGVVEAGASAAASASTSGHIIAAATEGTCLSGAFPRLITHARPDAHVTAIPCPLFVALAEEGLGDSPIADGMVREYLGAYFGPHSPNDTLLLGCTHFPLLIPSLRRVLGQQVHMVDCAESVAKDVERILIKLHLQAPTVQTGSVTFQATDAQARLARLAAKLMPDIGPEPAVELIDL